MSQGVALSGAAAQSDCEPWSIGVIGAQGPTLGSTFMFVFIMAAV
jgi:hypothetical protein